MDHNMMRTSIIACLLGGAVGEMVGYPFDTMSAEQIVAAHAGPPPGPDAPAVVADGTQLTLFTAEGMIRCHLRMKDRGLCNPQAAIWRAYHRWAYSQGLPFHPDPDFMLTPDSWLLRQPVMSDSAPLSRRCRQAVSDARGYPSVERPVNRSDGSGAIMRVAPAGLAGTSPDHAAQRAVWLAALTHGHERAHAASAAYAAMIAALATGTSLDDAVRVGCTVTDSLPGAHPLPAALDRALTVGRTQPDAAHVRATLGTGRTSLSALLHAVASVAAADDYTQAVLTAANHDGASATPAALAGQLAALLYGIDAIPAAWRTQCPVNDLIVELADDWTAILHGAPIGQFMHKGYQPF